MMPYHPSVNRACDCALLAVGFFRDRTGHWEIALLVETLAAIVAAAAIGWWVWTVWQRRLGQQPHRHPQRLFAALCRAHGLDRNQRRLLLQLAEHCQLPQPGMVFLEPERFAASNLSGFAGSQSEIKSLHDRLFAAK
jgi:hypothetical protein